MLFLVKFRARKTYGLNADIEPCLEGGVRGYAFLRPSDRHPDDYRLCYHDDDDDLLRSGANVDVSYRFLPYRTVITVPRDAGRTVVIDRVPRLQKYMVVRAEPAKPKRVRAKPLTFRRVCSNGRYARAPLGVDVTNIHAYVCIRLKKTYFRSTATGPLHRPLLYISRVGFLVRTIRHRRRTRMRCFFFFVPRVSPRPLKSARAKTISPPRVTRYYTCTVVYIIILHFIYLFEKGTLRPVFFLRAHCLVARRPRPPSAAEPFRAARPLAAVTHCMRKKKTKQNTSTVGRACRSS